MPYMCHSPVTQLPGPGLGTVGGVVEDDVDVVVSDDTVVDVVDVGEDGVTVVVVVVAVVAVVVVVVVVVAEPVVDDDAVEVVVAEVGVVVVSTAEKHAVIIIPAL